MVSLDSEQLKDLRESLKKTTLEEAASITHNRRKNTRPLYGVNSVMLRTLGNDFSPEDYQRNYFDDFKGDESLTEFAEFKDALEVYDREPIKENTVNLILEVGDLIYQRLVLDIEHKNNPLYAKAVGEMNEAIKFVFDKLNERKIPWEKVYELAKIKYGTRVWMESKGFQGKNKDLEETLCLELI